MLALTTLVSHCRMREDGGGNIIYSGGPVYGPASTTSANWIGKSVQENPRLSSSGILSSPRVWAPTGLCYWKLHTCF